MKRDILDHSGTKIGELEVDSSLSEPQIAALLAPYAAAPPVEKIEDVTPRQIRQALILSGITMSQIDDALSILPEPTQSLAKAEWEYSISFQRSRPLVASVGAMLGWSSEQLDALWKFARTL